jgi:hypothetical protein
MNADFGMRNDWNRGMKRVAGCGLRAASYGMRGKGCAAHHLLVFNCNDQDSIFHFSNEDTTLSDNRLSCDPFTVFAIFNGRLFSVKEISIYSTR